MNTFRKSFIKKKPLEKASAKAQSAMEYLMTYGWAILIISVVLAALFQLGVFNPMTFAPKAPPGACQVFRPNGPYTTSFINLEGVCSGELPQYVAQFNGQGYIYGSLTSYFGNNNPLTAVAWAYISPSGNGPIFGVTSCPPGGCWNMPFLSEDGLTVFGWIWGVNSNNPISYNVPYAGWYMLAITYNTSGSGTEDFYVNGQLVGSASGQYSPSGTTDYWTTYISGTKPSGVNSYYNSLIANVQAYSTNLTSGQIQALYLEGIGGAPIDLQHLVAWWPLNGNANDYSGNGNNGQISNVNFVSNWYNGYTPP
ncbi:MAG: LamG-like jellyroll fold domain-containing protein [Candidatus Micrarchaeota archaeon]